VQLRPEQHGSSAPPQASQVFAALPPLLAQIVPLPQIPPQQGCVAAPQPLHLPALHVP
jgi:hypothetical protein